MTMGAHEPGRWRTPNDCLRSSVVVQALVRITGEWLWEQEVGDWPSEWPSFRYLLLMQQIVTRQETWPQAGFTDLVSSIPE